MLNILKSYYSDAKPLEAIEQSTTTGSAKDNDVTQESTDYATKSPLAQQEIEDAKKKPNEAQKEDIVNDAQNSKNTLSNWIHSIMLLDGIESQDFKKFTYMVTLLFIALMASNF